jgi:2-polyprenyl-3-methyl-5-hydroxy-6-metoxy-1,4-benzoquinol methylase
VSSDNAQGRWDAIYGDHDKPGDPDSFVTESEFLPLPPTTVADFAGGTGGTALWLREQGFDVTLIDVSQVALDIAQQEATRRRLSLSTVHHDLESPNLLTGSWHMAVCCDFFDRTLYSTFHRHVAPHGPLFVRVATVTNQQRHPRPSKKYLVERGELPGLLPGFTALDYEEAWFDNRHEARMICRRTVD